MHSTYEQADVDRCRRKALVQGAMYLEWRDEERDGADRWRGRSDSDILTSLDTTHLRYVHL
jgi:hypothetical protein